MLKLSIKYPFAFPSHSRVVIVFESGALYIVENLYICDTYEKF